MTCENFGKRICFLRKEKNMSRDELAKKADISKNYLGMIERGERPQLSIKVIEDLSRALGVSLSDMFREIEENENPDVMNEEVANAAYRKEIIDTCYPPEHSYYHVSSLLKFLLYLPLIDTAHLIDALDRIGGSIVDQESYVLQKIDDCIKSIPPSSALSFVQSEEKKLNRSLAIRKFGSETLSPEERDILLHWDPDGRAEYIERISRAKEYYSALKQLEFYWSKE